MKAKDVLVGVGVALFFATTTAKFVRHVFKGDPKVNETQSAILVYEVKAAAKGLPEPKLYNSTFDVTIKLASKDASENLPTIKGVMVSNDGTSKEDCFGRVSDTTTRIIVKKGSAAPLSTNSEFEAANGELFVQQSKDFDGQIKEVRVELRDDKFVESVKSNGEEKVREFSGAALLPNQELKLWLLAINRNSLHLDYTRYQGDAVDGIESVTASIALQESNPSQIWRISLNAKQRVGSLDSGEAKYQLSEEVHLITSHGETVRFELKGTEATVTGILQNSKENTEVCVLKAASK